MGLVNISIVGNLTRSPEQIQFASGRVKTTMVVAVNHPSRSNKGTEAADYYRVETWGKMADMASKYLSKGNQVGVTGRLVFDHWIDKQGKNRITPVVEASQLSLPTRTRTTDAESAVEASTGANPIGGEIDLTDQEGEAIPTTPDSTYGNPFAEGSRVVSSSV